MTFTDAASFHHHKRENVQCNHGLLLLIDPLIRYGQYGIHSSQYGCFGEFVQRDSMQHQRLETFKILKRPKNRTL